MKEKNLDIKIYHSYKTSIMDMEGELDLSNNKWNFLFDFFSNSGASVYFWGYRFDFPDKDFELNLHNLSEDILFVGDDFHRLLFKVKDSSVLYGRKQLSDFWYYYDYPGLIFLKDKKEEKLLVKLCEEKAPRNEYLEVLNSILFLYRLSQLNVLWIERGKGIEFPEELKY